MLHCVEEWAVGRGHLQLSIGRGDREPGTGNREFKMAEGGKEGRKCHGCKGDLFLPAVHTDDSAFLF